MEEKTNKKNKKNSNSTSERILLFGFGFLIALVLFLLFFFLYPRWEMRPRVNVYIHKELIKLLSTEEDIDLWDEGAREELEVEGDDEEEDHNNEDYEQISI